MTSKKPKMRNPASGTLKKASGEHGARLIGDPRDDSRAKLRKPRWSDRRRGNDVF